jgi:hypothetical protein
VARNWSSKLAALVRWHLVVAYPGYDADGDDDYYVDLLAGLLQVACVAVCVAGLRMGKAVINSFTAAKVEWARGYFSCVFASVSFSFF